MFDTHLEKLIENNLALTLTSFESLQIFWNESELEMIRKSPLYEESLNQRSQIGREFLAIRNVSALLQLNNSFYSLAFSNRVAMLILYWYPIFRVPIP